VTIFSRAEAGAQLLRDTRGDPPDNGVLLSARELPVDALWRWPVQFVVGQCTVARILIEAESQLNFQDGVTRAH
jgi:hypothetical protein